MPLSGLAAEDGSPGWGWDWGWAGGCLVLGVGLLGSSGVVRVSVSPMVGIPVSRVDERFALGVG